MARNRRRERELLPVLTIVFDEVGEPEPMPELDTEPLPDEAFDWTGVPAEAREMVSTVLALADTCCSEFWHTERRTAVRRLLHDAAAQSTIPMFRGGSAKQAAAALCWLVDRANVAGGRLPVPLLLSHFGLEVLPGSRASTIRSAIGARRPGERRLRAEGVLGAVDLLGSTRYLTAAQRRHLVAVAAEEAEPGVDLSEACADLLDPGLVGEAARARRVDDAAGDRLF